MNCRDVLIQNLLDSGLNFSQIEHKTGITRKTVRRKINQGIIELYMAFDEYESRENEVMTFDWLYEEDVLDDVLRDAYYRDKAVLPKGDEGSERIGRYIKEKYGDIFGYLSSKQADVLVDSIYIKCNGCGEYCKITNFYRNSRSGYGLESKCKNCVNYRTTKYHKSWIVRNKEKFNSYQKKWQSKNRDKMIINQQRRWARKQYLPDNISDEDMQFIDVQFNNVCFLTGSNENIHYDHVIPLAIGHGGTTIGNVIPLRGDLNLSKNDNNIFEWFEVNRQRFKLSQERFDSLIVYLAAQNNLTPQEYREFYDWCFANPRTVDEIKRDQRHSLEIWREATGRTFELPGWTKTYYMSEESGVVAK